MQITKIPAGNKTYKNKVVRDKSNEIIDVLNLGFTGIYNLGANLTVHSHVGGLIWGVSGFNTSDTVFSLRSEDLAGNPGIELSADGKFTVIASQGSTSVFEQKIGGASSLKIATSNSVSSISRMMPGELVIETSGDTILYGVNGLLDFQDSVGLVAPNIEFQGEITLDGRTYAPQGIVVPAEPSEPGSAISHEYFLNNSGGSSVLTGQWGIFADTSGILNGNTNYSGVVNIPDADVGNGVIANMSPDLLDKIITSNCNWSIDACVESPGVVRVVMRVSFFIDLPVNSVINISVVK